MLVAVLYGQPAVAAFEFNFNRHSAPDSPANFIAGGWGFYYAGDTHFDCTADLNKCAPEPLDCTNNANFVCNIGEDPTNDPTKFYYERLYLDGKRYWHIVIGDPDTDDFAQDSYIAVLPDGGGGFIQSYSKGRSTLGWGPQDEGNLEEFSGNGWDPLGVNNSVVYTGNGTGNPLKVVMRQVMGTGSLSGSGNIRNWDCDLGQFCQEFLKSELGFKPKITQNYVADDIVIDFAIDMLAISYSDDTTAVTMVNTLRIIDSTFPASNPQFLSSEFFDASTQVGEADISAGKYAYTPGADALGIYNIGSYSYAGGEVANDFQLDIDWAAYYDATQNPLGAYPGNAERCANETHAVCTAAPYF